MTERTAAGPTAGPTTAGPTTAGPTTTGPTTGPAARARTRRPPAALWVALAGLVLTAVSSLVALGGAVSAPEGAVFRAVNGLPGWLDRPAWAMQLPGAPITPILAAAVLLVAGRWRPAFGLLLLAPLTLLAERDVLAKLVERHRPGETEPGAILHGVPPAGLSYPSGHAIVGAGMVVLLWPYLGRGGRAVAVLLAVSACVAPVYLGAHNPLDVVAGAGLGLLLGGLLTVLVGIHPGHRGSGR